MICQGDIASSQKLFCYLIQQVFGNYLLCSRSLEIDKA